MNENELQNDDNQTEQAHQLTDLPIENEDQGKRWWWYCGSGGFLYGTGGAGGNNR